MQKEDIGERLKLLRSHLGISQVKFAEILGIRQNYLSRYESGVSDFPDDLKDRLTKISDKKISLNWLVAGEGNMFLAELEPIRDLPREPSGKIPLLRQKVSCGSGQEWQEADIIEEYIEPLAAFPSMAGAVPYAFKVRGISMVGAGIADGDIVIFNGKPNQSLIDDIYVFALDNAVYCKLLRFDTIGKTIKIYSLVSDDMKKAELLKELTENDTQTGDVFKVFGKVIGWIHENRLMCR